MPGDYAYGGLLASTWDLFRGDTSTWSDRSFYLDLIGRYGEPALDVGCGTGRLLLDYLHEGIDIDGVDDSAEMLAICRQRAAAHALRPRLYEQKMETLSLPRRYGTIIVPSSSFQLLIEPAAAHAAMAGFAAHLRPAGALVMPFIDRAGLAPPEGSRRVREAVRPEDGATVRRTSSARFDEASGTEWSTELFELIVDGTVEQREEYQREPEVRWYSREHAVAVFVEAGLDVAAMLSGFTDRSAASDDEVFTIIGLRR